MSLMDLPPELVIHVLTYVTPDALIPFSLACRHIHNSAGPFLAEHKDLKARYSSVKVPLGWSLRALLPFVDNLRLATYPRQVTFTCDDQPYHRSPVSKSTLKQVLEIAQGCDFPTAASECPSLHAANVADASIAISFWILPEVKDVVIHGYLTLLRRSTEISLSRQVSGKDRFGNVTLQNLSKIAFIMSEVPHHGHDTLNLDTLQLYISSPNLKTVEINKHCIVGQGTQPSRYGCSGAEHLILQDSILTVQGMSGLIPYFRKLKGIRYAHRCPRYDLSFSMCYHDRGEHYDAQQTCDAIALFAGSTLKTLHLDVACGENPTPGIRTLQRFVSLERLTLTMATLLDKDKHLPKLIDILPASIREVQVEQWHQYQFREPIEGLKLLAGLPAMHVQQVPALRQITLGGDRPQTIISITNTSDKPERDLARLKEDFNSYIGKYDPSNHETISYTLTEYITWLTYRARRPQPLKAERIQWITS